MPEFKRVMVVMHGSSLWILGKEEGLSGDLTGHSLAVMHEYGRAARSGSGGDLSSDKSEFLRKRNPKKGGE
jgi:hypothetical protein